MQEILDFLRNNNVYPSGNSLIVLAFLYFVVWRDFQKRLSGLSAYVKRFLAIQNARRKATQELAGAIRQLCCQVSGGECEEECSHSRGE